MSDTEQPTVRDPGFRPPRCPYPKCSGHESKGAFTYRKRGSYVRRIDGALVQRFQCTICFRSFSSQTFRLDYRLKRPDTIAPIYAALCSKTTLRKTARNLGLGREHVARRLRLLARHARLYHRHRLDEAIRSNGGIGSAFQFDELETYEEHRKLKPVTVAVLIEQRTGFIVHTDAETLPPRKPLNSRQKRQLERIEEREGLRTSGSLAAVRRTVDALHGVAPRSGFVFVTTDKKSSYRSTLKRALGPRLQHRRVDGRAERGTASPLFPINHTLARLRDLASRLVRQTWGAAKTRSALGDQLDVIVAFRNYVDGWRSEPAARQKTTAAVELGVASRRLSPNEFLYWLDPLLAPA